MIVTIDPRSPEPPYEQLRATLVDAVRRGKLAPGERLPTVRKLAGDLRLAPNTVARAYRELESAGVVETRGRHGTFVAAATDSVLTEAATAAEAFARRVGTLGIAPDEALDLIRAAFRRTTANSTK